MSDEPMPLTILGHNIGTCTGWDQNDTASFTFYDFKPIEGITIPTCSSLTVIYDDGRWEAYNENGDAVATGDLLTTLRGIAP